jgi:hypothetical protein
LRKQLEATLWTIKLEVRSDFLARGVERTGEESSGEKLK